MFALEGDVLQEALREDETDDRQSDGQRYEGADNHLSGGDDAAISASPVHFSGRDREVEDRPGTIRVSTFYPLVEARIFIGTLATGGSRV